MIHFLAQRGAVMFLAAAVAILTLHSVPAQAQDQHPRNWYQSHQTWASRCVAQLNRYGQWGRQRQYDQWCKSNVRFRSQYPDQQWHHQYTWDNGGISDGEPKNGGR